MKIDRKWNDILYAQYWEQLKKKTEVRNFKTISWSNQWKMNNKTGL